VYSNAILCDSNSFRKKYEIATDEIGNPIKQDEKKGVLREFKKGDIFFNYGCLPVSEDFIVESVNHSSIPMFQF
jgi:hypothetical protein